MTDQPLDILKRYWGFPGFRPLQEEIIQSVLAGTDTLALMPTGGGKSVCYQVPALARDGLCLVISPLIALMKDQVHHLQQRNIPAAAIFSGMHYREIDRVLDNAIYGKTKLLYLSPERLTTELAIERIRRMPVNLIAVDEAHCISQWGYDFRPAYLEIASLRELHPQTPVLALTATATEEVARDIQEKLAFSQGGAVFRQSFIRQNLAYVVLQEEGKEEKLLDILRKVPGSGIVYVRNRRRTKEIALLLRRRGIAADFYHAGLDPRERSDKQDAWIANKTRVMVCTNAFGMGIDKPDVRTVVHMELPDSLEAYFQEAGRGGRDGHKSYATLLYNANDRRNLEYQYEQSYPPLEEIRRIYRALGSHYQLAVGGGRGESYDFDIVAFSQNYQLDLMRTFNGLKILEQAGWIALTDAVYQPATLQILVDKDQLYDYELKHPTMDPIIKSILRSYQGAFSGTINLREHQLANFLKMPVEKLRRALQQMHQEGIIDYRAARDQPQLIFLEDRADADNLAIDQQLYVFRKNRHLERIKAAIAYAETPRCRSRQLVAYFGEEDAPACGICDVCTGRTRQDLSDEEFRALQEKISKLLKREALTLQEIVGSFAPKWENQVIKTLEYLLDEGQIIREEEKLKLKNGHPQ